MEKCYNLLECILQMLLIAFAVQIVFGVMPYIFNGLDKHVSLMDNPAGPYVVEVVYVDKHGGTLLP